MRFSNRASSCSGAPSPPSKIYHANTLWILTTFPLHYPHEAPYVPTEWPAIGLGQLSRSASDCSFERQELADLYKIPVEQKPVVQIKDLWNKDLWYTSKDLWYNNLWYT